MAVITCLDLSRPRRLVREKYDDIMLEYKLMSPKQQAKVKTAVKLTETALMVSLTFTGMPVYASSADKVIRAVQPLIDLVQGLGYPICLLTMTAGGVVMSFNRKKGIQLIKDAAIAFLVIQFVPSLMKMLIEVGRGMAN